MSSLLDTQGASAQRPNQGVRQIVNAGEEHPVDAGIASDMSEGEIQDDLPLDEERKRSPSIEEQRLSERSISGPELPSFENRRNPTRRLPCVISVNEHTPFGSLYPTKDGFEVLLFLDAGQFGDPAIQLSFGYSGTETGEDIARNNWDMAARLPGGEWAMNEFEHGYAPLGGPHPRMSNQAALAECHNEDRKHTVYMRFKSWAIAAGFIKKEAFNGEDSGIQKSLQIMFFPGQNQYTLETWFIAPFDASDFRRNCLNHFTNSLASRLHPLHRWQDDDGNYYNEMTKLPRPASLARSIYQEPLRMPAARTEDDDSESESDEHGEQ